MADVPNIRPQGFTPVQTAPQKNGEKSRPRSPDSFIAPKDKPAPQSVALPPGLMPEIQKIEPMLSPALDAIERLLKSIESGNAKEAKMALVKGSPLTKQLAMELGVSPQNLSGRKIYAYLESLPDTSKAWPDNLSFLVDGLGLCLISGYVTIQQEEILLSHPNARFDSSTVQSHREIIKAAALKLQKALVEMKKSLETPR